jgi:hypothetical protein
MEKNNNSPTLQRIWLTLDFYFQFCSNGMSKKLNGIVEIIAPKIFCGIRYIFYPEFLCSCGEKNGF